MDLLFSSSLFLVTCNIYTYLECGNKGEPIVGGGCVCSPPVDVAVSSAAVSGWRKFLRCSIRSWCCDKHLASVSGSDSICSWMRRREITKEDTCQVALRFYRVYFPANFRFKHKYNWDNSHDKSGKVGSNGEIEILVFTWTAFILSSKCVIFSSRTSCRLDMSLTISYTVFCVFAISVIVFALSISFLWSIFTLRNLTLRNNGYNGSVEH